MHVEITIASTDQLGRILLTWTPVQGTARLIDGPGQGQSVPVILRNAGAIGKLVFDVIRTHRGTATLNLSLPGDGSPVRFWVAGEFLKPSESFGDTILEVVDANTAAVLNSTPLMVRIRKNANKLTQAERDRFLDAFGTLNGQGSGRFTDFRLMHVAGTLGESHGNYGFLPWHRAYLLDLERELQAIKFEVTLPYWRFDEPAPSVFTTAFMGLPDPTGTLDFVDGHPFKQWVTLDELGILRDMDFEPDEKPPGLRTEVETIAFGNGAYKDFSVIVRDAANNVDPDRSGIEIDPHGFAHTSFTGFIQFPRSAPRDPLFFLLHGNVDRMWAKWQWFHKRSSDVDPNAYVQGNGLRIGHNLGDTMWPWNGPNPPPRPSGNPPGDTLAASALTSAPGPSPMVRAMIDYQGIGGGPHLGFDYDDVPFEMPDPAIG